MPWQGHLFIGQRVHDKKEAAAIMRKLAPASLSTKNIKDTPIAKTIRYRGKKFSVKIEFLFEVEGGAVLPMKGDYTDAMVGFALTRRYRGVILDEEYQNGGRPEPFPFDPTELTKILKQVRKWWPEAQTLIWTIWH